MKKKKKNKEKENHSSHLKKQGSIKFKLLGIIIPVVSIIVLLLIIISYTQSKKIITSNANNLLEDSAKNQVHQIEAWLDENLASFQAVKTAIESSVQSGEGLQSVLNAFAGYSNNYADGLYIADSTGNLLAASGSTAHTGEDILNSVWYQEGLTRINMAFGSPYKNKEGKNVISASGMLLNQSGEMKVISADVNLDKISIIVNSLVEMKDAEAILIDRDDNVILAARDSSLISTSLESSNNTLYKKIAGKISNRKLDAVKIDKHMVNFKKISGTNWVLVSYVPTSSVYANLLQLRSFMIGIGVLSILLLIALIERVTHVVLKPIKMLTNTIITMGKGDFTMNLEVKGNDEISLMTASLKDFIAVMRSMLNDMNSIASQLHQQSEGSSQIADQLYDASTMQSDSMKNLNITVDELTHSVNDIADSATTLAHFVSETSTEGTKVNSKMEETVSRSEQGRADMEHVREAMGSIQTSITNLEEAINAVGSASHEITNIVSLIGEIAEQTSLLSLNASIEAARAGDAGRGFAVVASEIGKLSSTSTHAVQNIEKLIKDIIELVANAVRQSEESAEYINQSSAKIATVANTFEIIFDDIQATSGLVQSMLDKVVHVDTVATNVAAISEEQAASSEEILATSEEMVQQASAIADSSQKVANDSQQLKETADRLGEKVQMFQL